MKVKPFTAAELEETEKPDVEARLTNAEQTLSLLAILTRAVSQSQDLGFYAEQQQPGWALASDLACSALADVQAIEDALPGPVQFTKAPRKPLGAR